MLRVLVAGAGGALGRCVLEELRQRGHWTRALCRRNTSLPADEFVLADALCPGELGTTNIDVVFSSVGQTVSADLSIRRPGFRDVDIPANLNLLTAARNSGVRRFVYVSVFQADRHPRTAYFSAHSSVAKAVRESGLSYAIIEPTGFFSALGAVIDLARRNQAVVFGSGEARSNPIDEGELAKVCADAIEGSSSQTVPVGGPEVHTRNEIRELAYACLNKPGSKLRIPLWVPSAMALAARVPAPRVADMMAFVRLISEHDFVAPSYGTKRLADYFRELTVESRGTRTEVRSS